MNKLLFNAILPCPLCKSKWAVTDVVLEQYRNYWYYITCANCRLSSPLRNSETVSVRIWNNIAHKIAKLDS